MVHNVNPVFTHAIYVLLDIHVLNVKDYQKEEMHLLPANVNLDIMIGIKVVLNVNPLVLLVHLLLIVKLEMIVTLLFQELINLVIIVIIVFTLVLLVLVLIVV